MPESLEEKARRSRLTALRMVKDAKAAHIGSSLSLIDIMTVVVSLSTPKTEIGNVVLVSKGHAAAGVYAVLNTFEIIPDNWIDSYCKDGSPLGGHVTSKNVPFLELSTGSLGHALPFGVGRALAKRNLGHSGQVFVLLSDGECDEGSNWEAILMAGHLKLGNLRVIIDRNRLQSLGDTESTVALEPFLSKWQTFNWSVEEIDGHDVNKLTEVLTRDTQGKPSVVVANTTKGKGVDFMEGNNLWHYRPPSEDEYLEAIEGLK